MTQPLLLDAYCGPGGAGQGYALSGYRVVGIDKEPQPHNPHEHYQDDALHVLDVLLAGGVWHGYRLRDFKAIHASPPCQEYTYSGLFSLPTSADTPVECPVCYAIHVLDSAPLVKRYPVHERHADLADCRRWQRHRAGHWRVVQAKRQKVIIR